MLSFTYGSRKKLLKRMLKMKLISTITILVSIMFANKVEAFEDNWMEVPLDHFNLFDNRTWQMRYYVEDKFFQENNPIFIEVGGEWTIDGNMLEAGQVYKLAEKHHGLLIETEHRFYGHSLPFGKNFSTENLRMLQMELALEDLAFFIDKFKHSDPKYANSKVVLHGCSYPGMLVTWMRLKFPHLVDMAYASSAPLGVGLDYPEYYEIVNDVYANVSVSCIETIREGFNATAELMKTHEGRQTVREALKGWSCGPVYFMNSYQILRMMMTVLNVQNDPLQYEELSCIMLSMDTDDTDAFHRLAKMVLLKSKDEGPCSGGDDDDDDGDDSGDSDAQRNGVAWSYQTCTEQGTFQTLNRENSRHPFAMDISVDESVENCVNEFGGIVTEQVLRNGVERVTRRYGGKKPKVTKVVTVQGNHDPWRDLAVLEDYTPEAPVLLAQGSHCIDIAGDMPNDPADLVAIRVQARDYISKWLREIS